MIRFGVHCSLRDGLTGSLLEAKEKGCESMQIFTKSPRIWRMREPALEEVAEFKALRASLKIFPLVVHTPYLPNLATSKSELYDKSKAALFDDLRISSLIGADYLVIHPGSYSEGASLEFGVKRVAAAFNEILSRFESNVMILIENTAGGGRRLGSNFAEIAGLMKQVDSKNIGLCLDTAHAIGSGYDLSTNNAVEQMFNEIDVTIGLEHLEMIHFNDSKTASGSRRDRHEHIGKGFIGLEGFRQIIKRSAGLAKAGILETPKDPPGADKKNIKILFDMRRKLIEKCIKQK